MCFADVDFSVDDKGYTPRAGHQQRLAQFNSDILKCQFARFCDVDQGIKCTVTSPLTGIVYSAVLLTPINDKSASAYLHFEAYTDLIAHAQDSKLFYAEPVKTSKSNDYTKTVRCADGGYELIAYTNNYFSYRCKPVPAKLITVVDNWLRDAIEKHQTKALPVFLNHETFRTIFSGMLKTQAEPLVVALLSTVNDTILQSLVDTYVSCLSNGYPELKTLLKGKLTADREAVYEETRCTLKELMKQEVTHMATQNYDFSKTIAEYRNSKLKQETLAVVDSGVILPALHTVIEALFDKHSKKPIIEFLVEDMRIILHAYGKVVAERLVDAVEQALETMFERFQQRIQAYPCEIDDQTLAACMREVSFVVNKRIAMQAQLVAMQAAEGEYKVLIGENNTISIM